MLPEALQAVLKQRPLGLAFDIDGTLSPIAPTPAEARLYPGIAESLRQASSYASVSIVTGRSIATGSGMVGVETLTYSGTNGLEWSSDFARNVQILPAAQPYLEPSQRVMDLAERELGNEPGILIERKVLGGAIHFRLAPDPIQARQRVLAVLEEPVRQAGLYLGEGKLMLEVRLGLATKGTALRHLVEQQQLRGIVFAGDDWTDLDAIMEIKKLRQHNLTAYGIVVQHHDTPPALVEHADYAVPEVSGMAELLREIVALLQR
jgi:trehalose 6-phosphate phosphatase